MFFVRKYRTREARRQSKLQLGYKCFEEPALVSDGTHLEVPHNGSRENTSYRFVAMMSMHPDGNLVSSD